MSRAVDRLWSVATNRPYVDADELWSCLRAVSEEASLDARTQLLIRDGLSALLQRGTPLPPTDDATLRQLEQISRSAGSDFGFPTLGDRLMNATTPEHILTMFRELGRRLRQPASIAVGGSTGLILRDLLRRNTDDIDVVNEVPKTLRDNHELLHDLSRRYGLNLTHFQSHYLPDGWERRLEYLDSFDELDVRLVAALDIATGKLFSRRSKDLDDLRVLLPALGTDALRTHLARSTRSFRSDEALRTVAQDNWYILTGEKELPPLVQDAG